MLRLQASWPLCFPAQLPLPASFVPHAVRQRVLRASNRVPSRRPGRTRGGGREPGRDPRRPGAAMEVVEPGSEPGLVSRRIAGAGVARWDASELARQRAFPSLSFAEPQLREQELTGDGAHHGAGPREGPSAMAEHGISIKFSTSTSAQQPQQHPQQSILIQMPAGTSFYGTGEVGGALERTRKRVFAWNTDSWGYGPGTPSLYQSHPWVFAVLPNGNSVGFLADTSRRCEVDLRTPDVVKFCADAPFPLITCGPCQDPSDVLHLLAKLIGTISMPPLWALGFHQCRFSYEPAERVKQVARDFRARRIPCDVLWMDIDYMDGFRCFTFDPAKFPDPPGLTQELHQDGFKAVWMLDPGIKAEPGYAVHDSGSERDVWVLTKEGRPFVGEVWPGDCLFPDYTMQRARDWWADWVQDFCASGAVDGIWNDMNEPAVFKSVTKTMPATNVHRGDAHLGGEQPHSVYHNVYGMLMAASTFRGIQRARPGLRPFVLTRAGYIGSQRYAATWTGDNLATWAHLHMSIAMALNLTLSGQPFSGPDIGGFAGDATPRLFGRWMGVGALLPFARGHSEKGTRDHEPWVFGGECEEVCRRALQRRYRLLPHLYTLFFHAHSKGSPVMAPLFFADPADKTLRTEEASFLLGPLLVACFTSSLASADPGAVRLPRGAPHWRRFHFDDRHPDLPLLYLRTGAILASYSTPPQCVASCTPSDPVTLLVALDANGGASGELFEDAGDGYGFQGTDFLLTRYRASSRPAPGAGGGGGPEARTVLVEVAGQEGGRARPRRDLTVRLLLEDDLWVEAHGVDGSPVEVSVPTGEALAALRAARDAAMPPVRGSPLADGPEDGRKLKVPSVVTVAAGDFSFRVAPNVGGRITSLLHIPSGQELLEGRYDMGGYEEYCGTEYRSGGCSEPYLVTEHIVAADSGEDARLRVEGDVGGGLLMRREFQCSARAPETLRISSAIQASAVGAGSGGFSRVVCLRIHPSFRLNPVTEGDMCFVRFTSLAGEAKVFRPEFGEVWLKGDDRPAGVWELVNTEANRVIRNEFQTGEVETCFLHWGGGYCNLELLSQERPVSAETPLTITHSYTVVQN